MPTLSRIDVHPIKSLDPVEVERAAITEVGGLEGDREYAILDGDGDYVNGKRTAAVHRIDAEFDLGAGAVELDRPGADARHFDLGGDRGPLEAWLGDHFGHPVSVERTAGGGFTDSSSGSGPTLLSAATLREVASWFPGIDADGVRRRLRPNLVVEGVPAFWEDRLVGERFRVGSVTLEGVKPVPRCVVPTRDPHTGEVTGDFRSTFVEERRRTLPEWADPDDFEHFYSVMVVTRAPESERGKAIEVGDEVRPVEEAPAE